MVGWLKALLFVVGGIAAAAGTAYVTGLLDPWLQRDQPVIAAPSEPIAPQPELQQEPAVSEEVAPLPQETVTADKQDRIVLPTFDVLRVEPDGSALIAGSAAPDASIQVLDGDTVLSSTTAGPEGDFVVVLDEALKPGDYQLSLRAISGDVVANSVETAVVSIPEKPDGQVLALVDTPGAPAELVTVPDAASEAATTDPVEEEVAAAPETTPAAEVAAEEQAAIGAQDGSVPQQAAQEGPAEAPIAEMQDPARAEDDTTPETGIAAAPEAEAPGGAPEQPAISDRVVVEAVEIEGGTIFVAGHAAPGRIVRVYADETLLGEARVSEAGRFLVEAQRDLPVGNYLIRADLLDANGTVVARAAVPFEREPGEAIAAVAPQQPAATAQDAAPQETAVAEETETGAETEVAAAPALQRVDGAVIIRRGDSLWRISRRVYGRGVRYSTIYLANQDQIRNPDRIWPGQVFTVPQETPEGEEADMEAVADQVVEPEAQPAAQ